MSGLWITLNAADLALTRAILSGGGTELNPIMAGLFERGFIWGVILKISVVLGVILLLRKRKHVMAALCGGMGLVVVFNLLGFSMIG